MKEFMDSLFLSSSWKVEVQDLLLLKKRKTPDTGTLRAGKPFSITLNFINDRSRNPAGRQALRDDGFMKKGSHPERATRRVSGSTAWVVSRGFTLIELLVVVLIIGILSAVAVPQYTRAVEKSRITEAKILLKALSDAEDVYVLSNGDPCGTYNIEDLDISLPGTVIENGSGVRTKNFDIYIDECVYYDDTVGKGNARAFFADRLGQEWSVLWGGPSYGEFKNGSFYCWNAYSKEDEICPKAGAIKNAEGYWIFQ